MLVDRSPVQTLNKVLFDLLKAALPCPVHDGVPQNQRTPYVAIVETDCLPWNSKTTKGAEITATIRAYSTYRGDKEVSGLASAVMAASGAMSRFLPDDWYVVHFSASQHKVERTTDECREAEIELYFKIFDMKE